MCSNVKHIGESEPICEEIDESVPKYAVESAENGNPVVSGAVPLGSYGIEVCDNCPLRREISILNSERSYWRAMHAKAVEREARLKEEKAELEAKLKLREKQLYGRKSEKKFGEIRNSKDPTAKRDPEGGSAEAEVTVAGTIPIWKRKRRSRACLKMNEPVRFAGFLSRSFRIRKIPSFSKSKSGPTGESSNGKSIFPHVAVAPGPKSSGLLPPPESCPREFTAFRSGSKRCWTNISS